MNTRALYRLSLLCKGKHECKNKENSEPQSSDLSYAKGKRWERYDNIKLANISEFSQVLIMLGAHCAIFFGSFWSSARVSPSSCGVHRVVYVG